MATLYSAVQATPDASETVEGKLRIATNAEGLAGTDDTSAMTPLKTANAIAASGVTGGLVYRGSYDASLQTPNLTTASKGDFYIVSVAGALAGQALNIGDHIVFNQNASSPITAAMFDTIDNTDAVSSVNGQTGVVSLTATDVSALASGDNVSELTNDAGYITSNLSASITVDTDGAYDLGTESAGFDKIYGNLEGAVCFKAKNASGSQITKGQPIYISGINGDVPEVSLADADAAAMPSAGLAGETANAGAEIRILTFGNLEGVDTSAFSLGDTLYIDTTAGALTATPPAGEAAKLQNIGKVIRVHATEGVIKVGGAGRSAATPNLDQDKIFLGNASNRAVSTALSAVALSSFNNDLGLALVATTGAYSDLSGTPTLGTAAALDAGTSASNVVQLDGSARLPAVDGSQLTNLPSASAASETVAGVIEIATDAEAGTGTATDKALVPSNVSSLSLSSSQVTGLATVATTGAYSDLSGTPTLGTAAALVVGTGANNVVQLDGSSRLPAVDGSQLTNLPSGSGVDPTITVLTNTTYTLSAANAPGVHIWYGASNSSTFTVTMPDIANVLSSAVSVNGDPGPTFEVYIGRGQAGDITVSAADGIDLLGDGSITYSTTQTVDSGQWVKLVGWYVSGSTQRYLMDSAAQPRDAGLTSISGLTTSADQLIYTTASDTYATASLTAAGRALLDDADAAAQRATLGAIAELSEDLSPQLAGDLDLNGQDIVTTSNADLDLAPNGTGAVVLKGNTTGGNNQGKIKFNCENNSHAVTIQGPAHSAAATYTLTLPTSDGNANQVLKTDGSGVLDWVDQTSAGESEQIKQVSSNYTVTTADIEDGVRILYTGTASVWYVTLPDPSSLLSSASTVGGAAVDAVSVQVGRDRTGDINFASSSPNVGLLNDGNTGAANANRTTRGGEWVRSVGFFNGTTSNPDWLVEDTSNAYPWAYVAQTTTDYLAPSTYHACSGTLTMTARMSRFDNAQLVLVRNVGTGTITIDGYSTDTVDGQASITLSAGEYVELMANTSNSDFEIINQSYDASDLVAPRTGVNYTASNTDSITTHLAGIDTALGNVGGGGSSYTYSAITAGTTSAQVWYHYSVDTSSGSVTLNLPALAGLTDGDEIRVKLRDATNSCTIDGNSTETIDGSQTFTLDVVYSSVTLVAGSAEWEIV